VKQLIPLRSTPAYDKDSNAQSCLYPCELMKMADPDGREQAGEFVVE
jgi:hypothetical protein